MSAPREAGRVPVWELEIRSSAEAAEAVADLLLREGAAGVATEDPEDIRSLIEAQDASIFVDPAFLADLPDYVRIRAYFQAEDAEALQGEWREKLARLGEFLPLGEGLIACRAVREEDWANSWKRHYRPLPISARVTVVPSWEEYAARADEIVLTLDPGSAFGTGEHETTALCLQAVEELGCAGERVLDLGCGSGILGILAAKLGAAEVEALDTDPNAVAVTRANAAQNGCADRLTARVGTLGAAAHARYALILANILAEVHVQLASDYAEKLDGGGRLLLSGIIAHKADAVRAALDATGLRLRATRRRGDWVLLIYEKEG